MTKSDEDFLRHLHRQMEEQRRDQGLTTIRALQRRKKQQSKNKTTPKNNSK